MEEIKDVSITDNNQSKLNWRQCKLSAKNEAREKELRKILKDVDLRTYSKEAQTILKNWHHEEVNSEIVLKVIEFIVKNNKPGGILVFLPGMQDILSVKKAVDNSKVREKCVLYMLHSKLIDSQNKVYDRVGDDLYKIILATNLAESSVTIEDVFYVINTGLSKKLVFDPDNNTNSFELDFISKVSVLFDYILIFNDFY